MVIEFIIDDDETIEGGGWVLEEGKIALGLTEGGSKNGKGLFREMGELGVGFGIEESGT